MSDKRKARPASDAPPPPDERELTEAEARERAEGFEDTGLEPEARHEDFARDVEDSSPEMSSVEDELLERGMHIEEPPEAKERQPVPGGARRGEPLRLSEEEDDFEDGRSSGGVHSRLELDRWERGEQGGLLEERGEDVEAPAAIPFVAPEMRRGKRAGRKTRAQTARRSKRKARSRGRASARR